MPSGNRRGLPNSDAAKATELLNQAIESNSAANLRQVRPNSAKNLRGDALLSLLNVSVIFVVAMGPQAVDQCLELVDRMQRTGRSSQPVTAALLTSIQDDAIELWRSAEVSASLVRWLRPRSPSDDAAAASPSVSQRQIICCQVLSRVFVVSKQ